MNLTIERFDLDERIRPTNTARMTPRQAPFPTGFPFIIDDETQEVIEPLAFHLATKFNSERCYRGSIWTKLNSADAAAADLKSWWTFIHEHPTKPDWNDVSDRFLALYLKALARAPSEKSGDFLSSTTIRRHCASIDAFNAFARVKWPGSHFPSMGAAKILAGFSTTGKRHASDEVPHPLTDAQVRAVNQALGPLPSKRRSSQSSRSRLAWAIAVQVGLRVDEIVNLKAATFHNMTVDPTKHMGATVLRIEKTKGLVPREVYFPNWLIAEIKIYLEAERAESVERGRLIWIKSDDVIPPELLLNRPDAGSNAGKRATADSIESDFNGVITQLGLVVSREVLAGTAEAKDVEIPRHVFHDGRHTYAHWTYSGLLEQKMSVGAAWLLLRNRLGHKNVKTTIDTYLKAFSEIPDSAIELLVEHLRQLSGEANP